MRDLWRERRWRVVLVLWLAVVLLITAITAVFVPLLISAKHEADQTKAQLGNQAQVSSEQARALARANDRITALGGTPVATPSPGATGPTGATGATGPGPSAQQIQAAVDSYCLTATCGLAPTAAQVATAVASYCDTRGQCAGPTGASGANGEDGAQGPQGAPGQNATADQVAAAVATYCGTGACTGASGAAGSPGATGSPGPSGPSGPSGEPPESWTYTDTLGLQHTCSRTSTFDPSAPTYTCS